jgi:flagellin
MTVINTNIKALYTQSALKVSERDGAIAMQQLASGKRINSSKDDAAGLAIAARMTQSIQGLGQSIRNAGDAISMIQTAEGATQEITVILLRCSELAMQAANDTYSDVQRGFLNNEFEQLKEEINRIAITHEWNGFPILNCKDVVTSTLAGTYIEFADMGTATESLSIPNYNGYDGGAGPASASGALSFQSGILYRGDGTNPNAIGSVDPNLNGTLGKPLRINLGYVFSDAANQFFNPTNQHFYEVVTPSSAKTWQQAKDLAQSRSLFSLNGYLATVTDASEQSFINGQLAGKQGWIGASDQDVSLGGLGEGNWAWLTGPEAGTLFYQGSFNTGSALASKFANWSWGEPNNSGNEEYAYILGNGQWNDYPGSFTVDSYVVEYGGGGAFGTYAAPTLTATDLQNIRARVIYSDSSGAKSLGRLNFQVGPAANQLIYIDLADFGKNGDITGPITSDRASTNLLTVNSSKDVIMNVNKSLDRIAATRATMGAVMNRLEHVIDNLTNVVMNSEASRSQIEDADYAQASTELAKTQIKQQAATAVLAQANLSSQMVLKLLRQN